MLEVLHDRGVKLVLMRCAGFNNVDLEAATRLGIRVMRVPGYSPEAVAEHAMALALAVGRKLHKAYIKVRENNFSLQGLLGVNFLRQDRRYRRHRQDRRGHGEDLPRLRDAGPGLRRVP